MTVLAARRREPQLADRLMAHRTSSRKTGSTDRGVFDTLKRRRETENDPQDLGQAVARFQTLFGTTDIDALRDAAIDVSAAAMQIVCRLPPRDLNLE